MDNSLRTDSTLRTQLSSTAPLPAEQQAIPLLLRAEPSLSLAITVVCSSIHLAAKSSFWPTKKDFAALPILTAFPSAKKFRDLQLSTARSRRYRLEISPEKAY